MGFELRAEGQGGDWFTQLGESVLDRKGRRNPRSGFDVFKERKWASGDDLG